MVEELTNDTSLDYRNMNTDVIVTVESGDKYVASFITYQRLFELIEEYRENGTNLSGSYFWMKNMVLVRDLRASNLKPVIEDLMAHGDFQLIFEKM